jgi:heme A synthase
MRLAILLTASLALTAGCATTLPHPINANGSVSPTATVSDLDLVYQDSAALATTYVATCHAAMTTPGCNEGLIARLKAASTSAKTALHAAHAAVKDFPTGGSGLDKAIADLQAALKFLEAYTGQIPTSIATVRTTP